MNNRIIQRLFKFHNLLYFMALEDVNRRAFLKMLGFGVTTAASGSALEVFAGNPCYRRNREIYSRNDSASSQWCCQRLRNGRVVYYRVYTPAHATQYHTEREETPPKPPPLSDYIIKAQKEMGKREEEFRREPTTYEKQMAKDLTEVVLDNLLLIFESALK